MKTLKFLSALILIIFASCEEISVIRFQLSLDVYPLNSGTVVGSGEYESGMTINLTATPAEGFAFVNWKCGETEISTEPSFSYTMLNENTLLTAHFKSTYTLTYIAGAGGTITGTSPQTVNHGESGTAVTAVPNTGYRFVKWSDDVTTATRTDVNVMTNITVEAYFKSYIQNVTFIVTDNDVPVSNATIKIDETNTEITTDNNGIASIELEDGQYFYTLTIVKSIGGNFMVEGEDVTIELKLVQDVEKNIYETTTIGNQTWMASNLKTTKYNDGTNIVLTEDAQEWSTLTSPSYSWYNNDISNKDVYGALYNWFVVESNKICPTGWHVPSTEEWFVLENFIDPSINDVNATGWRGTYIATKIKATYGWENNGTNDYNFSALPGGLTYVNFWGVGSYAYWWSSTQAYDTSSDAYARGIYNGGNSMNNSGTRKVSGLSIRCIKD